MFRRIQNSVIRWLKGRRDSSYAPIISPSSSPEKVRQHIHHHRKFCRSRTHCVVGVFLLSICALTVLVILYMGVFVLKKSEPLIISWHAPYVEQANSRDHLSPTMKSVNPSYANESQSHIIHDLLGFWRNGTTVPTENVTSSGVRGVNSTSHTVATNSTLEIIKEHVEPNQDAYDAEFQSLQEVEKPEPACQLPKLKPFDPSILEYVEALPELDCASQYRRPIVFTTDFDSNLILVENPSDHALHDCCYRSFERDTEDEVVIHETCHPIVKNITRIPADYEFIIVYCRTHGNSTKTRPIDMFAFVHPTSDRLGLSQAEWIAKYSKLDPQKPKDPLNIVVVGIDAVSHMNFIRTMPETYAYLQNVSAIGMEGYVKVGDNTFPNMVPVLMGLDVSELEGVCWPNEDTPFDGCPFIWKNYSQAGYITSYAEDEQWIASFNYMKPGFQVQPTDYYLRPFMFTLGETLGHVNTGNANLCYGPRWGLTVLLNYVKKLAVTMGSPSVGRSYFAFTWANSLSHDDLNTPRYGDADLQAFLRWFQEDTDDLLDADNTVLVLMSDHGIRWGDIRTTFQGRVEERMPFLYFLFPEWFQEKYTDAIANLKSNVKRLTTPFDLHETLLDLVDTERTISNDVLRAHRHSQAGRRSQFPRGISLFTPVPESRTCEDAGIDVHWCVCHSMRPITNPESDERVVNASAAVVAVLNEMLAEYPQCSRLELVMVLNAQELVLPSLPDSSEDDKDEAEATTGADYVDDGMATAGEEADGNENVADEAADSNRGRGEDEERFVVDKPRRSSSKLTLTFQTTPGDAVFEASVLQEDGDEDDEGEWKLSGDISRVNLYGNQSACVHEYRMKKFCYCDHSSPS